MHDIQCVWPSKRASCLFASTSQHVTALSPPAVNSSALPSEVTCTVISHTPPEPATACFRCLYTTRGGSTKAAPAVWSCMDHIRIVVSREPEKTHSGERGPAARGRSGHTV
jgi:hypothetical protein